MTGQLIALTAAQPGRRSSKRESGVGRRGRQVVRGGLPPTSLRARPRAGSELEHWHMEKEQRLKVTTRLG